MSAPPPALDQATDEVPDHAPDGPDELADQLAEQLDDQLADQLRLAVGRLARRIRQQGALGLTPSQHSALATIERLGPVRLGDVAAAEGVAAPTLTKIAAALEDMGYVRRTPDPADGRSSLVSITPAGKAALRKIRRARTAFLRQQLDRLSPQERAQLARALPVLIALSEASR